MDNVASKVLLGNYILQTQKLEMNLFWKLSFFYVDMMSVLGALKEKNQITINLWESPTLQRPHPFALTI